MTVLLLAGQGSHAVGMGADIASRCSGCRAYFTRADDVLGYALSRLMAEGPESSLRRTEVAQPALLTVTVAQADHLRATGVDFTSIIGHSVGQYAALVVAGALSFDAALRLVSDRGRVMQETVPESVGAMAAISGLPRAAVSAACAAAREHGIVEVACHNAPEQTVISGQARAVNQVMDVCLDEGGGAVELPVSVPSHCSLLAPMVPAFASRLRAVDFRMPVTPVIDNVTAAPFEDVESMRRSLVLHLQAPVLFEESVGLVVARGARRFISVGKRMISLARKIVPEGEFAEFRAMTEDAWRGNHVETLCG